MTGAVIQEQTSLPVSAQEQPSNPGRDWRRAGVWCATAICCFHLAYSSPAFGLVMLGYLFSLVQMAKAQKARPAFYGGLAVGLLTAGPQLVCFWKIFGPGAVALWCVLAFWIALFVSLARLCLIRFRRLFGFLLIPVLWTGLEYFRSELYYLRFSWLNCAYALAGTPVLPLVHAMGTYGVGFVMAASAAAGAALSLRVGASVLSLIMLLGVGIPFLFYPAPNRAGGDGGRQVRMAGVQLEFPSPMDVVAALDGLIKREPQADLLVLSEYTFDGPVPDPVKSWCRRNHRYLVVGGKDEAPRSNFYDTAFVVDPNGEIIFKQVKAVPIQFFKDGLPAREQKLWSSPWGKIGICVCYDLSYTKVTDRLIRMGAEALVVPTMDVVDWGLRQHELHARVAPVRSAEYGVPIFRVASSGISQHTDTNGRVLASAGMPGQNEIISSTVLLNGTGSLPFDRWPAPFSTAVSLGLTVWFVVTSFAGQRAREAMGVIEQTKVNRTA